MTVSAFKKKEPPPDPVIPYGTVVFLNSDANDEIPMTTSKIENGQVLCRWHDGGGNLQGDWFYPRELHVREVETEVDFKPDFDLDDK